MEALLTKPAKLLSGTMYLGVGNVLVKQSQGSAPITTTYDFANRIVTAIQGAVITTLSYDNAGNSTLRS